MKQILLTISFLIPLLIHSQKQYINVSADIRNGIIGSEPTNNTPALDLLILAGVTDKHGITIEIGYENFKSIEFQKTYFGLGYTFITRNKKLEQTITIEPTYITREWNTSEYEAEKRTYSSIGASSRVTYNFNKSFGISLLGNLLLRTDNEERYEISTPKVFSIYLGITYTFKNKSITLNKSKMAHRKTIQIIMSEPQIVKSAPYTTKSGQTKTRHYLNQYAKPVKSIVHEKQFN